jgi:outer membrane protein assembly factor BamC
MGLPKESAQTVVAQDKPVVFSSRVVQEGGFSVIKLDDTFERAWRRVGVALDRTGFTVEDRDRNNGLYYVRYAPPGAAEKESNFFTRLFSPSDAGSVQPLKYRVLVKTAGNTTTVSALNSQGVPDNSDNAQRIIKLLGDDLK